MKGPGTKELSIKCGAGHVASGVLKWTVFLVWDVLQKTHVNGRYFWFGTSRKKNTYSSTASNTTAAYDLIHKNTLNVLVFMPQQGIGV